jgi:hypothetical protein
MSRDDRRLEGIRERVPENWAGTHSITVKWDDVVFLLTEIDRLSSGPSKEDQILINRARIAAGCAWDSKSGGLGNETEPQEPEVRCILRNCAERLAVLTRHVRKCEACVIEAEIGTQENPHPVPARYHTCACMGLF